MNRATTVAAAGLLMLAFASLGAAADPAAPPETGVTVRIPEQSTVLPSATPRPASGRPSAPAAATPAVQPSAAPAVVGEGQAPVVADAPAADAHDLDLDVASAVAGGTMVATVHGFTPGEKVRFTVYSKPLAAGDSVANGDGTASSSFTIPKNLPVGLHTIEAVGWVSHRVANSTFLVVDGSATGSSLFPWIIWAIAGGVLFLALMAAWIAAARRSLPILQTRPTAPTEGPEL